MARSCNLDFNLLPVRWRGNIGRGEVSEAFLSHNINQPSNQPTISKPFISILMVLQLERGQPPHPPNLHCNCNQNPISVFPKKNRAASVPFPHLCVCERFIYSQDRSTYFLQQNSQTNRGNTVHINSAHECGNWDWGRVIPFLFLFWEYLFRIFGIVSCSVI